MENIAEKLKEFRKSSGKSQQDFASAVGIAQKTWSNYENGITTPPMKVLFDLAERGYIIKGLTSNFMDDWPEEKKKEYQRRMEILKTGVFPLDMPMDDFVKIVKAVDEHPPSMKLSPSKEKHPLVSDIEVLIKDNLKDYLFKVEKIESRLSALEERLKAASNLEYPAEAGDGGGYTQDPEPEYNAQLVIIPFCDDIAAGPPIWQFEDKGWVVDVPRYLIKTKESDYYALRVKGNSMIDAFIPDGSMVLIKKSDVPQHGKIQVIWLDNRVTLKRMQEEEDHSWTLCYEDGTGRTIPLGEENLVQGDFDAVLPPATRPRMRGE